MAAFARRGNSPELFKNIKTWAAIHQQSRQSRKKMEKILRNLQSTKTDSGRNTKSEYTDY